MALVLENFAVIFSIFQASLIALLAQVIAFAIETLENPLGIRVDDPLGRFFSFEVSLGHIGGVKRIVDQHVIPGFILRRPGKRHFAVPLVGPLKAGIDVENNPNILKQPVVNDLPDLEFCLAF